MYDSICAFQRKLLILQKQIAANNFAQFPTLKSLQNTDDLCDDDHTENYSEKISQLQL